MGKNCYEDCETCYEKSDDKYNMKCITCIDGLFILFNTSNCVNKSHYADYYLNLTENIIYPCSFLNENNCYECDPYLNTTSKCLSCQRGYIYI